MVLTEALLLSLIILTCVRASVSDLKTGLVPNRVLAAAGIAALILDAVYYAFFVRELFAVFLINLAVSVFFSLLLYIFHFWGAGDSKLFMLIILAMPSRFYSDSGTGVPTLGIIIFTFSAAFAYLMAESVVLGIKQKNLFEFKNKLTLKRAAGFVKNYFISCVYIFCFSFAEKLLLSDAPGQSGYILPLLNFFAIFAVFSYDLFRKWYVIAAVAAADAVLALIFSRDAQLYLPPLWNIAVIITVIIFRSIAEKYNYKTVPTSEVKAGSVLALQTVMLFRGSRVRGLPQETTEDLRSRITEEEAASIRRWESSKTGKPEIVLVRKLPFAIFIFIGTIVFLALRRWMS